MAQVVMLREQPLIGSKVVGPLSQFAYFQWLQRGQASLDGLTAVLRWAKPFLPRKLSGLEGIRRRAGKVMPPCRSNLSNSARAAMS
jgi:hypothetical protein